MSKAIVLIFLFQVYIVSTLKLPPYLKKCQMKSPDLQKCLMDNFQSGNKVLSENGDSDFKINKIDLIEMDVFELQATPTLNASLINVQISGINNSDPKFIELTEDKLTFQTFFNLIDFKATAKVAGKLLMFSLEGEGDAEVFYEKVLVTYHADLKTFDKNGQKFVRIIRDHCDLVPGGLKFNLTNVFSWNDALGENLNKLLNLYWKEIHEEVYDAISTVISTVIRRIVQKYFNQIPVDELIEK